MKRLFWASCLSFSFASPAFAATDFSGSWEVSVREFGGANYYLPMTDGRLILEKRGEDYGGRFNQLTFTGTVEKDGLHLACNEQGRACGALVVQIAKDQLSGKGELIASSPQIAIPVTLEGRHPATRPASPASHNYDPQTFTNFYSPTLKPVLRLFPGDTVKTRTLDSRGHDRDGRPRAPRGNPLIGPFYVEGAMPGDTLVVHLGLVRTNRDSAYQTNLIASTALEAGYLRGLAKYESGFTAWKIDAAAGIATVINPSDRLKPYTVKLSPMLGCIGVAPRGEETLGSGHLGPFGGNMDSPEIREGATLYIPVFRPGALLYMGDGHAQQGAGELPGQGLETSMDVQFTVDVIPNKSLGLTRVENAGYVMVMGTGADLDAAMKSATTGLSRWLADSYHLTPQDIAAVLGTAMEYEIAEVVDSEYDVVAKISKDALTRLGK
ncbi:MAG TPA: acetamidase/formamidase family protein [Rhizomicrobium sp.]|jgi:acetamidase/formamidase|nr:acetamidase/formamidase family protein [Rhizomicrobium sp.]